MDLRTVADLSELRAVEEGLLRAIFAHILVLILFLQCDRVSGVLAEKIGI